MARSYLKKIKIFLKDAREKVIKAMDFGITSSVFVSENRWLLDFTCGYRDFCVFNVRVSECVFRSFVCLTDFKIVIYVLPGVLLPLVCVFRPTHGFF